MSARSYIVDDREKKTFLLDREVLVSDDILRTEMARIFGRCWIYVGHASELKKPGDFRSRKVAGRPVIFCRDQKGKIHCLFNTCRHRGAIVCTEREGNRRRFQCIYHGWTYGNDGRSWACRAATPMRSSSTSRIGLRRPARFEDYRGFWFMNLERTRRRSTTISRAPRTTSTWSSTSRRPGRWRSSPACRNTTSPPTGS